MADLTCHCPLLEELVGSTCTDPATEEDGMCDYCREKCATVLAERNLAEQFQAAMCRVKHICETFEQSIAGFKEAYLA